MRSRKETIPQCCMGKQLRCGNGGAAYKYKQQCTCKDVRKAKEGADREYWGKG